jgi:erythromycin esterase-like protein
MAALADIIREAAIPLPPIDSTAFSEYFDWLGQYKFVLLGDGTHGTSEFYAARAEITKRLVQEHGFKLVALEADWPDAEAIDHYVRRCPKLPGQPEAREMPFERFPTWMWRNREMQDLVHWLRDYNDHVPAEEKVRVYGLDLYSMSRSMNAVVQYLQEIDPEMAKEAGQRYSRLQRWVDREQEYALKMHLSPALRSCEEDVVGMLVELLKHRLEYSAVARKDGERFHSAQQEATLVVDAEEYYRKMYCSPEVTWNLRDRHMYETLQRVMDFHRPSKRAAVIWAHNSHVGDARHTDMGLSQGEINLGQLCRERNPPHDVCLVGCGTHDGTVAVADHWGGDMEVVQVNPSREDSWERVCHDAGPTQFLLDMRKGHCDEKVLQELAAARLARYIGVIYRPMNEKVSHYSASRLSGQFDAYIFFQTTHAVNALGQRQPDSGAESETYPFGL